MKAKIILTGIAAILITVASITTVDAQPRRWHRGHARVVVVPPIPRIVIAPPVPRVVVAPYYHRPRYNGYYAGRQHRRGHYRDRCDNGYGYGNNGYNGNGNGYYRR